MKQRRRGAPLEIPQIDHKKASQKLQKIIGKIDNIDKADPPTSPGMGALNSVKARGGDHTELIKSLPSFGNRAKRGFSHTGAKSVIGGSDEQNPSSSASAGFYAGGRG